MIPPTWATAPTPGARHELGQIKRVARMLGTPLMPWQEQVARVASEIRADGKGWRWPTILITVPRQSGKTTLMRTVLAQRSMTRHRHGSWYTAQTGKDAKARWKDLVNTIEDVPLFDPRIGDTKKLITTRLAAGDPAFTFERTRSTISPFSPTGKTGGSGAVLHGYTPHLVMLDEAFAFTEEVGTNLLGAILPAQQTLDWRQLWIVSTAGNADSSWFKEWVDRAHEAASNPDSTIAGFNWSAPDGADLYDPATWHTYHPALGHTITTETLAEQSMTCPPGEWRRAYGNLWTTTREAVLDITAWDQLSAAITPPPADTTIGLAYDVHHDRSHASLWTAWMDHDHAIIRPVRSAPGIDWLIPAIHQARAELGARAVLAAHDDGPTRQITDALTAEGTEVTRIGQRDYATACGAMLWRANTAAITHDGSPGLRAAWQDAAHRPSGDSWLFSRTLSSGPIDALIAALIAVRVASHTATEDKPYIYLG